MYAQDVSLSSDIVQTDVTTVLLDTLHYNKVGGVSINIVMTHDPTSTYDLTSNSPYKFVSQEGLLILSLKHIHAVLKSSTGGPQ